MPLNDLSMNFTRKGKDDNTYEPQRSNNAILVVNDFNFGGKTSDALTMAIKGFPLPKSTTNVVEISFLNQVRKFPGKTTYDDVAITFNDYINAGTAEAIAAWRELVKGSQNGRVGLMSEIARNATIITFAPNGAMTRGYDLVNLWPSSDDFGDIDYASDEAVTLSVTFTVDIARPRSDSGMDIIYAKAAKILEFGQGLGVAAVAT